MVRACWLVAALVWAAGGVALLVDRRGDDAWPGPGVRVRVSSTDFYAGSHPVFLVDGDEREPWVSADWHPWLEITLAERRTLDTVVIHHAAEPFTSADFRVSVRTAGGWRVVDAVKRNRLTQTRHRFAEVAADAVRVDFDKATLNGESRARIFEVELMARERIPCAYLLVGLAVRLVAVAWWGDGTIHADQTYQSVEPAHHLAFGYGALTWEWFAGLRSWLVPLFYAMPFRAAALLGLDQPVVLARLAQLLCAAISLLVVDASWRLTRARASRPAAHLAAALATVLPALLYYAPHTLNDGPSAALLVAAYARLEEGEERAAFIAGLFAGGAYLFRYPAPIFLAGCVAVLLARRQWRAVAALAAGFAVVFVVVGLADWPTWGAPFRSVYRYVMYNVVEGKSRNFGVQSAGSYLAGFYRDLGPLGFVTLGVASVGAVRGGRVGAGLFIGLAVTLWMPHKEERFFLPFWVCLPSLVAIGVDRLGKLWGGVVVAVCLASHAVGYLPRDFGPLRCVPQALRGIAAGPDARGVLVGYGSAVTGGYLSLHHPITLVAREEPDASLIDNQVFNYLVFDSARLPTGSFEEVDRCGDVVLLRRH